jgi:DEAD/DEAH box helicase domain-containing protein
MGLHAACHAIANVMPLFTRCSPGDAITHCEHASAKRYEARRLIIADRCKGGNGLSRKIHDVWLELIEAALSVVKQCPCTSRRGCPSCVYMLSCTDHNVTLDKRSAILILEGMLLGENSDGDLGGKKVGDVDEADLHDMVFRRQRTLW